MRGMSLRFASLKAGLPARGQYVLGRSCSWPTPSIFPSTLLHLSAGLVPRFALLYAFFYVILSNINLIFFRPNENIPTLSKFRGNAGLQTQTSAQILNLFPLLRTQTVDLPAVDVLHSPALYVTSSLFVPERQAGVTREHSHPQTSF